MRNREWEARRDALTEMMVYVNAFMMALIVVFGSLLWAVQP